MDEVTIRDLTSGDKEIFCELALSFYKSDAVYKNISRERLCSTFYACVNNSPLVRGMLVFYKDMISGYVLLTFSYSNEFGGKIMSIDEIYIKDEYRRKGVASCVVSTVIAEYEHEVPYVEIVVRKDNATSISLWNKFDFAPNDYLTMHKFLV